MIRIALTLENRGTDYGFVRQYASDRGFDCVWRPLEDHHDRQATIAALCDCEAVIAGGSVFDEAVLSALSPMLRIIARFGIGYEHIDMECATKLGVAVTNTPGCMSAGVADLAIGMMLNIGRQISRLDNTIKTGGWDPRFTGFELEGKTVGLVGFGNIARRLAKYLSGFDCRVLAYDVAFDQHEAPNAAPADLDTIACESDYVSIHLPMTDETAGIIDNKFFEKMKPTAFLINTARGGVVAERDMIEALKSGRIAGAALDVFEREPLPEDSELRGLENCVFTPHIASYTIETASKAAFLAIDNITDLFEGRVPKNILNPGFNNERSENSEIRI